VPHPTLGLPPRSLTAGYPAAAERLRAGRAALAGQALTAALRRDASFGDRYDDIGRRRLLRDAEGYIEQIARSVAGDDTHWSASWAEMAVPVLRRRRVPMRDLVALSEGLRESLPSVLSPDEQRPANEALDAAIKVFKWHGRIGGDHSRGWLIDAIYKGA
jgi:hypothetical protein